MWTKKDIPDLAGKKVIVTGANTGIGYQTAVALYESGADVIIACRNKKKAEQAIETIKMSAGRGSLESMILDLASLSDIERFSKEFKEKHKHLAILINNAGVMVPPATKTKNGFELQFGVNFLGHFALTAHLFEALQNTQNSRIVTVSSGASTLVNAIDFDNLQLEKSYDPEREYAISKLAGLQFSFELDRRLKLINSHVISTAAHPGVVRTDLQRHIEEDKLEVAFSKFSAVSDPWQGALPILFAATSDLVTGGDYYGPDGENEYSGYPAPSKLLSGAEQDKVQREKLWNYAQEKTHLIFP